MSTKIIFSNENGTYAVEVPQQEMPLPQLMELVVAPVLLAAGYPPKIVNTYLYGEDLNG